MSRRYLAEWSLDESVRVVEQLYAAGALQVWAVAFDRNLPYESINTLIIALPDKRDPRARALELANQNKTRQGFDTEQDCGQTHLHLWFD